MSDQVSDFDLQEQGFLRRICADPTDDETRLVFADWLKDHGDPRCGLLRLETACRRFSDDCPERRDLERQKLEYLKTGVVLPLNANCIDTPRDHALLVSAAEQGIPIKNSGQMVSPTLARLTCQLFDFTNAIGMRLPWLHQASPVPSNRLASSLPLSSIAVSARNNWPAPGHFC